MLKAIVCVSYDEQNLNNELSWGIGKNNGLLFNIPSDMDFFKTTTIKNTVVMGYNTLLSLPGGKPLKNRKTIVLCPEGTEPDGCIVFHDAKKCIKYCQELAASEDVFVCGGAMLYKTFINYCDEIFVTKVYSIDQNTTAFFPNLDKMRNFRCAIESEQHEENGYKFKFTKYIKLKNKAYKNVSVDNIDKKICK